MAMKKFLSDLDDFHKEIINMNSCEYLYLNGVKMDISFQDKKHPNPIPLSFIRENIKDSYLEDVVFLNNIGEIIKKEMKIKYSQ